MKYLMWSGGLGEHLDSGSARLMIVVPFTCLLILLLLFVTFHSSKEAALAFTGIPFAASGVIELILREIPFSMIAGVGFNAVSGVVVLNGVVMVAFINQNKKKGLARTEAIRHGAVARLRTVLMAASSRRPPIPRWQSAVQRAPRFSGHLPPSSSGAW